MPDPEAVTEVAWSWLRRAKSDLATARGALADRDLVDPWVASFHAQQAAEKCLDAALTVEQIRFPRTHELERSGSLLPTAWGLPDLETLAGLSRFAVAGRYPEGMLDAGGRADLVGRRGCCSTGRVSADGCPEHCEVPRPP